MEIYDTHQIKLLSHIGKIYIDLTRSQ